MFANYLKIAIRYFIKNKVFSLINIFGLTLGFSCFILLSLFIRDEMSFDRFHNGYKEIYRVIQNIKDPDGSLRKVASVAPLVGTEAKELFPEVLDQTQLIEIGRLTVGNDVMNRDYERIWIADANFFQFFNFEFLYGDPQSALSRPDNLVITESTAKKYFGKTDVVGQTLYTNVYQARISAVIKDFPSNSHLSMNMIHAEPTWEREISDWKEWTSSNWTSNAFITYYKMAPDFEKRAFEQKLTGFVTSHYNNDMAYHSTFSLQPLSKIHLYSNEIEGGLNVNKGNPLYIYMFSIVAILILAIACFNYMNLSTAAGSRRIREIAMRKTLGADKKQLILQFTGETLILSLFSLIMAVVLIDILSHPIMAFLGRELVVPYDNFLFTAALVITTLLSGILSAIYPAFIFSRINPAARLKKEIRIRGQGLSLRKILVIAQFSISIIMIAVTIIIYQQLRFLQNKELGFNVNSLLVVDINSGTLRSRFESVKHAFESISEVQSVTVSSRVPGEWKVFPIANVTDRKNENKAQLIFVGADEDFLKTFDIQLTMGRNLRNDAADSNSVLISESALKSLNIDDPLGKSLIVTGTIWAGDLAEQDEPYTPVIVGVVKDFYFQSFREKRKPVMLASYRNPVHKIDYFTLRASTNNWQELITKLTAVNNRFDSENPLEYHFLDNRFVQFYKDDKIRGQLFLIFSGLIVLISSLGLFALSSFAIENRIKEIGVRKVLGAGVKNIIWLILSEFVSLVGIAALLGIPAAYFSVQNWLQEFAYRISIAWWVFPAAGVIALMIAVATISFKAIRAALTNPADALRYE